MALSQIQCLDDNHVNPRTHESKPEFLYCEEQRHALETLLRDGREAFFKQLEARGLRGFLSDPELEALAGTVELYNPGVDLYREDPEDEQTPLSLHYWPDLSDTSTPELDIGWPDSEAYRGVTRATVHTQPPLDGQTHIKEIIRKTIAQAQKVIAVVMDVFTDVDIFRDLLDASYKRKVSVYILLDRAAVPHFLSMCQRANMHAGHLKNLRVRCSGGTEFYTHSCKKVRGRMGHRFMFIDGDKAVSGSYSFTWTCSRLDRNLVTVVTGQAVDGFDRLFRFLYTSSRLVNLQHVALEPEPEPEPVPQPTSVAPSAAVARKLYNPKYALVAAGNPSLSPSSSAGNNSPKESQKDTKNEAATKKGRRRQSKDTIQEAKPLHPGLVDLEKVYLFDYLPTWPEPDPSADVIGFINIRDVSKPSPVHLQRSQMFEVSQAIRFSSPISVQKEILPEVATLRNTTPSKYVPNVPQPHHKTPGNATQNATQAITPMAKILTDSESDKENANVTKTKPPFESSPKISQSAIPNSNLLAPPQTVEAVTTPTVSNDSAQTEEEIYTQTSVLNSKSTLLRKNGTETYQTPKLFAPSDSNSQIKTQENNCYDNENTSPTGYIPVTFTSTSANYQVSQDTVVHSTLTNASPTLTTINTLVSKLNTNSPIAPSPIAPSPIAPPPIPKPRTVQLVIKNSLSGGQKIPEVSFVKKADGGEKETSAYNDPLVPIVSTPKEIKKVPELANKSASKSIPQKGTDSAVKAGSQEKERKKSQEESSVEAVDKAEVQLLASGKEISKTQTRVTKLLIEANVKNDVDIPKKDEVVNVQKGVLIERSDFLDKKPEEIHNRNSNIEVAKVLCQDNSKIACNYQAKANLLQRTTYSTSQENIDLLNSPINRSPILKTKSEIIPVIAVDTHSDISKVDGSASRSAKMNSLSPLPSPSGVPIKPTQLHVSTSPLTDSTTHEKESRTLLAQRHSPIRDEFPTCILTAETRRSHTPDIRTPTSDISDGYGSTTSDEFYECSESPLHESIDHVPFYSLNALEDKDIAVANNCGILKEQAAMLSNDRTTSCSETLNLSNKASLASILEKMDDEEKMAKENIQRRGETRKSVESLELQIEKNINQLKSSKALNQSVLVEQSLSPKLNNETTEAKRVPMRELKPKRVYPRAEQPNRAPAGAERTGLSTSEVERMETAPANKEPEGHKQQQSDSSVPAQARKVQSTRPSHPLSSTQSPFARPPGQRTERKMSDGNLPSPDGASSALSTLSSASSSSSRRLPPRPPAPPKPHPNQHHHRQPPTSPTRPKTGQTPIPYPPPKPQPSFLYSHTLDVQQTRSPPPHQAQAGAVPGGAGSEEEKTPFGITLSKFYNLKGLKDKMSKRPVQSRRSSGSGGATPQRKSTG